MGRSTRKYDVEGMTCAACAGNVEQSLCKVQGVDEVRVNLLGKKVVFTADENVTDEALKTAVARSGYKLITPSTEKNEKTNSDEVRLKLRLIVATAFSIPLFIIAMFVPPFPGHAWVQFALGLPVIIYSGSDFFAKSWKLLRAGQTSMDTLVALGAGSAFLLSLLQLLIPSLRTGNDLHLYFEAGAVVITLVLLGKYLEERAKRTAGSSLSKLLSDQPTEVTRLSENSEENIPVEMVQKNDRLRIKPGQRFPVDGIVMKGNSYVDESPMTGESDLMSKSEGDRVLSGTVNRDGVLEIRAEQVGSDTLLNRIVELVEDAQSQKAPIQKLADRISSIFVPAVVLVAILTAVIWAVIGGLGTIELLLTSSLSVLVIACPCALGLATPTAMTVALGRAARNGIVVKNTEQIQVMEKLDRLVLDKTGTLTEGGSEVRDIEWVAQDDPHHDEYLAVLATMENYSTHPLASAVVNFIGSEKATADLSSFEEVAGRGVMGKVGDRVYRVGNRSMFKDLGINLPESGSTLFSKDDQVIAIIEFDERIKEGVAEMVAAWKSQGLKVSLLSGDSAERVEAFCEKVGINDFHAELLPDQKLEQIDLFRANGDRVAMVGDGINDGPALMKADVGIALGTGSDIAMDSAGVGLLEGDLHAIDAFYHLSKETMRIIRQNYFWAFGYNVLAIPIAAGILYPINGYLMNPMIAGGAMALSSLSVVLNSLRLRR